MLYHRSKLTCAGEQSRGTVMQLFVDTVWPWKTHIRPIDYTRNAYDMSTMDLDWRSDQPHINALRQTQYRRLSFVPRFRTWIQDRHVDYGWHCSGL